MCQKIYTDIDDNTHGELRSQIRQTEKQYYRTKINFCKTMAAYPLIRLAITYDSLTYKLELFGTPGNMRRYTDKLELIHNAQIERDITPEIINQVIFQHIPITSKKQP